ncbi:family 43 glycosylhydrolase [Winogradskyella forsetii]|uniref:family 43 glycosylhydrolase n=1 Tax=Winogradskyella forsetii TaxID=2686077 RepID=UPI0015BFC1E3|nr:family 43 glycosylhydrolase [Winogradskyella forsetii]
MNDKKQILIILVLIVLSIHYSFAQNPLIRDQFTADPSARVFGDKVYVFPSHDILATEERGRKGWFCMEDYHVFSSENLTDWEDHGVIVTQNKVPWVRPNSYSMWAPDCIEKDGKYYFYFPSTAKDTLTNGRGFTIGVAIADQPEGPYTPESQPIKGVKGIDPNVFIDKDGQAYMYWSQGNIYVAKLKDNMVELDGEVITIDNLPTKGLKEGPYVFERNGVYYLTYPHVENKTERLEYAISDNPLGPFKVTGVIMDESPTGCWTNHQSIINFKNHWYLFYHHNDYSPSFDKARSIRADKLVFNPNGTIQKVTPTLRGIGISQAANKIEIDRYSKLSEQGTSITFIDTTNTFKGWKTVFNKQNAWIQYNDVDFDKEGIKQVKIKAKSSKGGVVQVNTEGLSGKVIAEINIPATEEWTEITAKINTKSKGIKDLFIQSKTDNPIEIDWITFEQ